MPMLMNAPPATIVKSTTRHHLINSLSMKIWTKKKEQTYEGNELQQPRHDWKKWVERQRKKLRLVTQSRWEDLTANRRCNGTSDWCDLLFFHVLVFTQFLKMEFWESIVLFAAFLLFHCGHHNWIGCVTSYLFYPTSNEMRYASILKKRLFLKMIIINSYMFTLV